MLLGSSRNFSKNKDIWKVIWNNTKIPLLFLVVFTFAALALYGLQDVKDDFEKRQKAPLLVTDSLPVKPEVNSGETKIAENNNTNDSSINAGNTNTAKDKQNNNPERKLFNFVRANKDAELVKLISAQREQELNKIGNEESAAEIAAILEKNRDTSLNQAERDSIKAAVKDKYKNILAEEQNILYESFAEIQYQIFKNEDDLINALNEAVSRKKDIALKNLEKKLDKSYENASNVYAKKAEMRVALDKLSPTLKDLRGEELTRLIKESLKSDAKEKEERLEQNNADDSERTFVKNTIKNTPQLPAVLNSVLGKLEKDKTAFSDGFNFKRLKDEVDKYFLPEIQEHEKIALGLRADIENTGKKYQPVFKSIYTTLKSGDSALFALYESGETSGNNASAGARFLLDDKSSFNVIYKLFVIVCVVVVVFTLLYLIWIPLNHIFFLATGTDALNDQAKKLLERKEMASAATSVGLGHAIVTTLTTVTIGAAVIFASPFVNDSIFKGSVDGTDGESKVTNLSKQNNFLKSFITNNPPVPEVNNETLIAKIVDLTTTVSVLEETIRNNPVKIGDIKVEPPQSPTINVDTSQVAAAMTGLNTRINELFGDSSKSGTVFGDLANVKTSLTGLNSSANQMNTSLSNLNTTANGINDTANNIYRRAGDIELLAKNTIVPSIDTVGDIANKINTTTGEVNTATTDIRRNTLGRDGKNLITQTKTLFSSERYKVTQAALDALSVHIAPSDFGLLEPDLRKLAVTGGEMNKKDLLKKISRPASVSNKAWKNLRRLILLYTRVPRY
jgi:hypothetical protein